MTTMTAERTPNRLVPDQEPPGRTALLLPRERQTLRLFWEGHTRKTAALALGISPRTVELHWQRAREKLGVAKTHLAAQQLAKVEGW